MKTFNKAIIQYASGTFTFSGGEVNWSRGVGAPKRVNTQFKMSLVDINELITALNSLNNHYHLNRLSTPSTNNPSISEPSTTSNQKITAAKVNSVRGWVEFLNTVDSTHHSHFSEAAYASVIWPTFPIYSWASVVSVDRKMTAADVNEVRLALENLNGHYHTFYYDCGCNGHSNCSCHCTCNSACGGISFG